MKERPGTCTHRLRSAVVASLGLVLLTLAPGPAHAGRLRDQAASHASPAPDRPNFVMLMTDDERADDMWVMPKTLRLIGAAGVTFSNAFVSYPMCCPSRATYFTGQYSHNHGVLYNKPPDGGYTALRDKGTTFPVALQRAGYTTIHFGKYLNGAGSSAATIPPGWTDYRGAVDPTTYNYYGFKLNVNGHIHAYPSTEKYYKTTLFARMAVSVIRREARARHPFFLNVAFLAPHSSGNKEEATGPKLPSIGKGLLDNQPATPPHRYAHSLDELKLPEGPAFDEPHMHNKPGFLEHGRYFQPFTRTDIAAITTRYHDRLESLMAVDDAVEQIVNTLRATGVLNNTVIMFTSDNGFFYGEHRIRAGKYFVYDPSVRVPLLIRGPGIARGVTRTQMVANIDLAPTILALAAAHPLRLMDGRSLVPMLRDGGESVHWNRALLLESGPNPDYPAVYHAIRTGRYTYVEYSTGDRELYDMKNDPNELNNLYGDPAYTGLIRRLHRHLASLRVCRGASCY
jgi:arylsulfatase A-like enzyme